MTTLTERQSMVSRYKDYFGPQGSSPNFMMMALIEDYEAKRGECLTETQLPTGGNLFVVDESKTADVINRQFQPQDGQETAGSVRETLNQLVKNTSKMFEHQWPLKRFMFEGRLLYMFNPRFRQPSAGNTSRAPQPNSDGDARGNRSSGDLQAREGAADDYGGGHEEEGNYPYFGYAQVQVPGADQPHSGGLQQAPLSAPANQSRLADCHLPTATDQGIYASRQQQLQPVDNAQRTRDRQLRSYLSGGNFQARSGGRATGDYASGGRHDEEDIYRYRGYQQVPIAGQEPHAGGFHGDPLWAPANHRAQVDRRFYPTPTELQVGNASRQQHVSGHIYPANPQVGGHYAGLVADSSYYTAGHTSGGGQAGQEPRAVDQRGAGHNFGLPAGSSSHMAINASRQQQLQHVSRNVYPPATNPQVGSHYAGPVANSYYHTGGYTSGGGQATQGLQPVSTTTADTLPTASYLQMDHSQARGNRATYLPASAAHTNTVSGDGSHNSNYPPIRSNEERPDQ